MMAAGLAGTYEYHNNVMQVQAAEQNGQRHSGIKRDCGKLYWQTT